MNVAKVLVIEGLVNAFVTTAKTIVGLHTGSMAILADAFHSATDLINNLITYLLQRIANKPADLDHPYGHRKFEFLGIFILAVLLCAVAIELLINTFTIDNEPVEQSVLGLWIMLISFVASVGISLFERYWGRVLNSKLLLADAKHTYADSLTTLAAIIGWQAAIMHFGWIDKVVAVVIVIIVLGMAYKLFVQSIPVLVDQAVVSRDAVLDTVLPIDGVETVSTVRSRSLGEEKVVEITITVDPTLTTQVSHKIADEVERVLAKKLEVQRVLVHVEPQPN
ncbi:cation diffusion facilitator family transporter [Alteromonas sp. ASW11-36]|uniref:Cation diffusion facilitator family transporter n=1 Tax=Alteromonas arenosi TaxID=3055817 RepID=A0ABT7SWP5_9ALTE|nr:cation diffusion facilitator family transporter [Alteromonas sp. ASW11-36]MDM7860419.1 cation diffusion facilitator family transporter [Alteromonas sp. ASW11-36]